MCSRLAAGNVLVPWDALNHLDSQDIVSPRDLRSTWSFIERPAGGAAWLCPSNQVEFLEEFREETLFTAIASPQWCGHMVRTV